MRTTKRLRIFMLVLCFVTALNGIVSYVQFQITPAELTEWGGWIQGARDWHRGHGQPHLRRLRRSPAQQADRPRV